MTPEQRAEAKRLCETAILSTSATSLGLSELETLMEDDPEPEDGQMRAVYEFAISMRGLCPKALAHIERLESELAEARKAQERMAKLEAHALMIRYIDAPAVPGDDPWIIYSDIDEDQHWIGSTLAEAIDNLPDAEVRSTPVKAPCTCGVCRECDWARSHE